MVSQDDIAKIAAIEDFVGVEFTGNINNQASVDNFIKEHYEHAQQIYRELLDYKLTSEY